MSLTPPPTKTRPKAQAAERPSIVLPAVVIGLVVVGAAVAYKMFQSSPPPPPATVTAPATTEVPATARPVLRPISPREETTENSSAPATAEAPRTTVAPAPSVPAAPSTPMVDTRLLMSGLTSLDIKGPISAEDAQKWKASLQQLVQQGSSSVSTIAAYLGQNQDVSYAGVQGADQLGYSSLRSALLNALGQIGGPDSTAAMLQTLQASVFPTDVATLSTLLEQQAPGQYQGQVLTAVRSQLALASQDQLGGANVGPLFQLLATAGATGTDVSADLTQYGSKWPYYSAIELANLPNGAGVSSLIQMAQNSNGGSQTAAAQELAQLAPQNSQALSTLLDMAKQGQLSDAQLAQIAPYLGGRENMLGAPTSPGGSSSQGIHIANGNQDFSAAEYVNALSPEQVTQRISIVDQLLQNIPADDSITQQALQQQKNALTARQGK